VVAYFSAQGAIKEAIEEAAWQDYEEEENPGRRSTTTYTIIEATGPKVSSAAFESIERTVSPLW